MIISSRFVLTAAHCIDHLRKTEFVVTVGNHAANTRSPKEQVFNVEGFAIHAKYRCKFLAFNSFDYLMICFSSLATKTGNDIALVKLATVNGKGIVFGDEAQPICLPSSETAYKAGTWCTVSGWGMQKRKSVSFLCF